MRNYKYKYEVWINSEYNCKKVEDKAMKIVKFFDTQEEAIKYARKLKNKLKSYFKGLDNTITLDIQQYKNVYDEDGYFINEDYNGIVYSINLVGRW